MSRLIDLTGQKFGRWTVIKLSKMLNARGGPLWLCRCDCGTKSRVEPQSLRSGGTKSCGCLRAEKAREAHLTHGHSKNDPTYRSWAAMRRRCLTESDKLYPYYGARGITICKSWMKFENFLIDMGERPPKLTLERDNNNGNYEPTNCFWATRKVQARNKRSAKLTLEDAIDIIKIRRSTSLSYREIAEKYNIDMTHAWRVCKGSLWPEALEAMGPEK